MLSECVRGFKWKFV